MPDSPEHSGSAEPDGGRGWPAWPPEWCKTGVMNDADLITVGMFGNRNDAEVARARLDSEGIPGYVQADDAGGFEPQLGLTNGVRLLVHAPQVARAIQTLEPLPEVAGGHRSPAWVIAMALVLSSVLVLLIGLPMVITVWRGLAG